MTGERPDLDAIKARADDRAEYNAGSSVYAVHPYADDVPALLAHIATLEARWNESKCEHGIPIPDLCSGITERDEEIATLEARMAEAIPKYMADDLADKVATLEAQIAAALAKHHPCPDGCGACGHCREPWPCPDYETIARALGVTS